MFLMSQSVGLTQQRVIIFADHYSKQTSKLFSLISTHLIADIEQVLDEAIFINQGRILLHENTTVLRNQHGKSIDEIFRDQFRVY